MYHSLQLKIQLLFLITINKVKMKGKICTVTNMYILTFIGKQSFIFFFTPYCTITYIIDFSLDKGRGTLSST